MITRRQYEEGSAAAARLLAAAGIPFSPEELAGIEVTDFGLGNYPAEGAQIITFLNTRKVGYKVICLLEGQALPEHRHTASLGEEGKEEPFRAAFGATRLFVPGDGPAPCPLGKEAVYTCRREVALAPPQQITLPPDTPHWLLGGPGGCVVYSLSSWARCALDHFTDPAVVRETVVTDGEG